MKTDVTLLDVYEKLGALDAKADNFDKKLDEVAAELRSQRGRLRRLELSRARLLGWCAGVCAAVTIAWELVGDKIKSIL